MGKFGIGAKVKDPDGDFGEIVGKPGKGLRTIRIAGGKYDGMEIDFLKSELEVVANDNEVSACAPVFEKEYSVGDRVRALVDWLDVKAGEEYTVKRLHLEYDGTVQGAWVLEENKGYLTIDEFERSTIAGGRQVRQDARWAEGGADRVHSAIARHRQSVPLDGKS